MNEWMNHWLTNFFNSESLAHVTTIPAGFYTLKGEDGRDRRVDYVADAAGFRATISTNEMGTAPKDSADGKFSVKTAS